MYITVTVHHVMAEWKLDFDVLRSRAMHDSHTGESIEVLLKEAGTECRLAAKDPTL